MQTSGLKWTIDLTSPAGQRIRDVRVGNVPIDPGRDYRVVSEQSVTEVVEAALKSRGTVRAPQLGNVTLIKPPES